MGLFEQALADGLIEPPPTREDAIVEDAVLDLLDTGRAVLPDGTVVEVR